MQTTQTMLCAVYIYKFSVYIVLALLHNTWHYRGGSLRRTRAKKMMITYIRANRWCARGAVSPDVISIHICELSQDLESVSVCVRITLMVHNVLLAV